MHFECRNGNYRVAGNNCPKIGHHFQVAKAAGLGYHCDEPGCGAELVRVVSLDKEHGRKRIPFVSKGLPIKFRSSKGPKRKSAGKKYRIK